MISGLFALLCIIALIAMIVGLIKPDKVVFWSKEKSKKQVLLVYGIGFLVLMIISGATSDKTNPKDKTSTSDSQVEQNQENEEKSTIGAPDQIAFHTKLKEIKSKYNDAEGEMKKSAVYRDMVSYLQSYLKSGNIQNWEGEITDIKTTEGGKKVSVTIESNLNNNEIKYGTWNNELSDWGSNSMIPIGSKVYKDLENIKEGNNVVFSAQFVYDDKRGFKEQSLTESGFVEKPDFVLRFMSIKKK